MARLQCWPGRKFTNVRTVTAQIQAAVSLRTTSAQPYYTAQAVAFKLASRRKTTVDMREVAIV